VLEAGHRIGVPEGPVEPSRELERQLALGAGNEELGQIVRTRECVRARTTRAIFCRPPTALGDQVEAVVDGEVENPLTYLEVVGASGSPGLSRVSIKVYVASPRDEKTLNQLWHETLERLPLVRTFRIELTFSPMSEE